MIYYNKRDNEDKQGIFYWTKTVRPATQDEHALIRAKDENLFF